MSGAGEYQEMAASVPPALKAITLTHVRYHRGDRVGLFLAWVSLIPVFISLGGFISHFMFRRELQGICFALGLLVSQVLNELIKHSVAQSRPASCALRAPAVAGEPRHGRLLMASRVPHYALQGVSRLPHRPAGQSPWISDPICADAMGFWLLIDALLANDWTLQSDNLRLLRNAGFAKHWDTNWYPTGIERIKKSDLTFLWINHMGLGGKQSVWILALSFLWSKGNRKSSYGWNHRDYSHRNLRACLHLNFNWLKSINWSIRI